MMLLDIRSEHGGVITFEYLIPVVYTPHGVPVSQRNQSGIGEKIVGNCATCITL
jgi:hypothetical protein